MKYKKYTNQRVKIKSTDEQGEAFESALGTISVFIDNDETNNKHRCRYFNIDDVIFL